MEPERPDESVREDSEFTPRVSEAADSRSLRELRLQQQSEAWEAILGAADTLLALGALDLTQWQRLFDAGGPVQGAWRMAMQPHDLAVVLSYVLSPGSPRDHVASTLRLSADDVEESLARLKYVGLLRYEIDRGLAVAPTMLLEFLSHGVRVAFPAVLGERVRGLGTAYVQSLVEAALAETEVAVWPSVDWGDEGRALYPLLPAAAEIADRHPRLYALLAAVDAIRLGRPRDALVARAFLAREILGLHKRAGERNSLGEAEAKRDEEEARWHDQLRQLWLLSKRLEEQRSPQAFTEFLATPQPILAGPHGTPVAPNAAVLTGDSERVLWLLEWVTTPADDGAPLRTDGESNAAELQGASTRDHVLYAATACLGSEDKAIRWLSKPNRALAGAIPYRLLDTEEGVLRVLQVIGRIEHGIIG